MCYVKGSQDLRRDPVSTRKNILFLFSVLMLATLSYHCFIFVPSVESERKHLLVTDDDTLTLSSKPYLADFARNEAVFSRFPQVSPFFFRPIPINSCDKDLLITVSGIGPTLAENILATRSSIGVFRSKDDLLQVPGIGNVRMEQFAAQFSFALPASTQ